MSQSADPAMGIHTAGSGGPSDSLLTVRNLQTHFFSREGVVKAVDGVSFDIRPGEILGIAGESGCGKSVTSQSILRILPKNGKIVEGEIFFKYGDRTVDLIQEDADGAVLRDIRGKEIAMIFQEPMTAFSPVHTVGDQIIETIRIHQQVSKEEAHEQALEMLRRVGMPNPARNIDQYTFNLSGGMRQRAMVALSLSCRPKLLIADEPTTAVDVTIQAQMLELLRDIQADLGMAIIMITHDLGVIAELTDRVMIMYLGKEVEHGTVEDVFHRPQHPYTRGLLSSIPKMEPGRVEIEPIEGAVPSPYAMPTGCKFHTRCPDYIEGVCEKQDPPLVEVARGHEVSCYLYGGREGLE
ncbi:MAG: ABC transporter ATP-binding protein [Caldilineaceae bacterium]|nr:ABC transporter ATP-binding protein [Caldilineaceae bacterium]